MKFSDKIQPRIVVAITAAIAALMIVSAVIELRQSRDELYHVLREEALSLVEAIQQSSRNTIVSTREIEGVLSDRLFNNASFIAHLDSLGILDDAQLARFAAVNGIFRINVFDRRGRKVLTSYTPHDEHAGLPERNSPVDFIRPILDGTADRLLIGLKEARYTEGQRFAVAVRRTGRAPGAIVLNLDAAELLEYRRTVGIGRLLTDLGDNSGIAYVALQDGDGIIAASRTVRELSSVADDPVLAGAMLTDSASFRTVPFDSADVFEAVHRLAIDDEVVGVLRIGLSMDELDATEDRMARRAVIMSAVLLILGTLMVVAIVAMQNYRLVERQYSSIRTLTGNILEQMQDAVVTVDGRGVVTLFNRQAQNLFGVSEEDAVGRAVAAVGGSGGTAPGRLFASEAPYEEIVVETPGSPRRDLAVSRSTTHAADGSVESRTAVVRDLTESRRLQAEVQRREKLTAMGELASTVAHEIRNPLNAISMTAQRFEKELEPRADLDEYRSLAAIIRSEAQRVNAIIQRFLRFARPPRPDIREVGATEFVDHVAGIFSSQAGAKGVAFSAASECPGTIAIDRALMTQALLNLLQNALDATAPGGSITLRCGPEGGMVKIAVGDTGAGIPPEDREKVFNLYYSTKRDGTGMGLPIVQQIVAQHGGSIALRSPGAGTEFTILLPAGGRTTI